jgi:hypothetical protein
MVIRPRRLWPGGNSMRVLDGSGKDCNLQLDTLDSDSLDLS